MPDEDNNFSGSLVLDFRKWWRHVQLRNKPEAEILKKSILRWLETVSSTFQDLKFDGSL